MSNCIAIVKGDVAFHKSVLNIPALRSKIEAVKGIKEPTIDEDGKWMIWYFLEANTAFHGDYALINFGAGRSVHCWRDFFGLLNHVIKPLMLGSKSHKFLAMDTDSGENKWCSMTVNFKDGVKW